MDLNRILSLKKDRIVKKIRYFIYKIKYLKIIEAQIESLSIDTREISEYIRFNGWVCYRDTGILPDFTDPKTYNEKIQWLKVFDRNKMMPILVDKIAVKQYVLKKSKNCKTPRIIWVSENHSDYYNDESFPQKYVLKTNHDSGGVVIIDKKLLSKDERVLKFEVLKERLNSIYGEGTGEWPYKKVEPRIFAEEYIETDQINAPDYKFHCVEGKVKWMQYIYDRGNFPKETIYDQNGNPTIYRLYEGLGPGVHKTIDVDIWNLMKSTAEELAEDFKYCRIDLYISGETIYLGEITFHPMGGCYKTKDNLYFGSLMNFTRKSSIYKSIE